MDTQEEIVRLLAIQLRRQAKSQSELIEELGRAGFGTTRISQLVGTTPNTVNQALIAAKKRGRPAGFQKAGKHGSQPEDS